MRVTCGTKLFALFRALDASTLPLLLTLHVLPSHAFDPPQELEINLVAPVDPEARHAEFGFDALYQVSSHEYLASAQAGALTVTAFTFSHSSRADVVAAGLRQAAAAV